MTRDQPRGVASRALVDGEVTLHPGSGVIRLVLCHLLGWFSGGLCDTLNWHLFLIFLGMATSGWDNRGPLGAFQFFPPLLHKQPTPLNYQPCPSS